MLKAVADTHALLWYLQNDPRLSQTANQIFDDADTAGDQIGISSISLAEIVYLSEKSRIPPTALGDVLQALDQVNPLFVEIPVDRSITAAMATIPRAQVPDMPDRIIAATAVRLAIPVISRDGKIQLSQVPTVW